MHQTLVASDHGAADSEPRTGRRQKAVLCIEELSMNTQVIAMELEREHDPRETSRLNLIERDLEELRSYVNRAGGIGDQLIEDALMHVHFAQREDRKENRSHTYIVGTSQEITEWTQQTPQ